MPNGRLSQAAAQGGAAAPAPAPQGGAAAAAPAPAPQGGGGGAPIAPQLAQAAAQAGAPAPGGGAPAPQGGGGGAGPPPAGPMPEGGGGPIPIGALSGNRRANPLQRGIDQVDPGAAAVEGHMPPGMNEEQATPEEQAEYERAMKALAKVLYANDKIANSIVDQIQEQDRVGSTTKVSILLVQQLDKKLQMDESIVAQMSQEVVSRIMELAEARHQFNYGDREGQVIMGAVWEGVQQMFGMEPQDAEALMAGIGGEGIADLKQQHEAFYNG